MTTLYRHAQLLIDSLPILDATDFSLSIEGRATNVRTAGHSGVMRGRGKPLVTGSLDIQIPSTGYEYEYVDALDEGSRVVVRWVDGPNVYDASVIINKVDLKDSPNGERSCSISFEGDLVS